MDSNELKALSTENSMDESEENDSQLQTVDSQSENREGKDIEMKIFNFNLL